MLQRLQPWKKMSKTSENVEIRDAEKANIQAPQGVMLVS
jgi:hypothetical protein